MVGSVAAIYAAGVLIGNVALAQYGYYQFDLLRPRAVAVGVTFALAASFPMWTGTLGAKGVLEAALGQRGVRGLPHVLAFVCGSLLGATVLGVGAFLIVGAGLFGFPAMWSLLLDIWWWFAAASALGLFLAIRLLRRRYVREGEPAPEPLASVIFSSLFGSIAAGAIVLFGYATDFYPQLPAAIGGGAPIHVYVMPTAGASETLSRAAGQDLGDPPLRLALIDETQSGYIFLIEDPAGPSVIVVRRELIDVIATRFDR